MDYFEKVKAAVLSIKTLVIIVILGIVALALLSISRRTDERIPLYSESKIEVANEDDEEIIDESLEEFTSEMESINPAEEAFPESIEVKSIDDIDYDHFNGQGTTNLFMDDNQLWLNSIQEKDDYNYVHFDGALIGKGDDEFTDYNLQFYQVSELDEDATYEAYVYMAYTLKNIELRLGSDQCFWISNNTIRSANGNFNVEITGSEEYIPYILVELIEYKNGEENIYSRNLISSEGSNFVDVYRVFDPDAE